VCGFDQAPRIRWSGSAGRFSVAFVDLHSPTRAVHVLCTASQSANSLLV